jgi:hypothetical protein
MAEIEENRPEAFGRKKIVPSAWIHSKNVFRGNPDTGTLPVPLYQQVL